MYCYQNIFLLTIFLLFAPTLDPVNGQQAVAPISQRLGSKKRNGKKKKSVLTYVAVPIMIVLCPIAVGYGLANGEEDAAIGQPEKWVEKGFLPEQKDTPLLTTSWSGDDFGTMLAGESSPASVSWAPAGAAKKKHVATKSSFVENLGALEALAISAPVTKKKLGVNQQRDDGITLDDDQFLVSNDGNSDTSSLPGSSQRVVTYDRSSGGSSDFWEGNHDSSKSMQLVEDSKEVPNRIKNEDIPLMMEEEKEQAKDDQGEDSKPSSSLEKEEENGSDLDFFWEYVASDGEEEKLTYEKIMSNESYFPRNQSEKRLFAIILSQGPQKRKFHFFRKNEESS